MAKKNIKNVLDDLIREEGRERKHEKKNDRIMALDIPVTFSGNDTAKVNLDPVVIFDGIETIVGHLLDKIRESCFWGQSDVSVSVNVERTVCPQLYNYGVSRIVFYSPVENMEGLPAFYDQIVNHLRYIFNALQSPSIIRDFFDNEKVSDDNNAALLFPFNREAAGDKTGLHYLVEKLHGGHFMRITAEELGHARLNLRRINHRIISNIELIDDFFNIRVEASTIHAACVQQSFENKRMFKDAGLQLATLIRFLKKAGYSHLAEMTVNWPVEVATDLLMKTNNHWYGSICRTLLVLSDSTTVHLLNEGKTIETTYRHTKIFISLTQRSRNLQLDLQEKVKILPLENYLEAMPTLKKVTDMHRGSLSKTHLILIHHFTGETLGVLGALDRMGVACTDTLWVKYAGNVPPKYMETILALPGALFRFYGVRPLDNQKMQSGFCLSDRYSPIDDYTALQGQLKSGNFDFYDAMQAMGMQLFLNAVANGEDDMKVLIAEDGGYLAPLVNLLVLEGKTVGDVFQQFGYENEKVPIADLTQPFKSWIAPRFAGSVEHTRNGYDALAGVEDRFSKLAFPACSLAVSKFKVYDESLEVAYSCINAIENIMNGQGFVFNNRRCLVIGSLGAIGIQTMKILVNRVGAEKLAGIDIKPATGQPCKWEQFVSPDEVPGEIRYNTDLFFGVVGKSLLARAFFEDITLNTTCREIFLASGSTKRFEFSDFQNWVASLTTSSKPTIGGVPVKTVLKNIEDPQTAVLQGTVFSIEFKERMAGKRVDYYMLSNLMPVNFQYYGVPRETMDRVMSEFVSLTKVVATGNNLPPRLLALDHAIDIEGRLL